MRILSPVFKQTENVELEDLVTKIKDHAENLYLSRQFLCTEAVLISMNAALGGTLTEQQAVSMAAPFCIAMGDSGCLCGALSGAVMATSLFTGEKNPYSLRKDMREQGKLLHDIFRAVNGATCCRVLSKKVKHDKKAHFQQCATITANSAEMAARLVLSSRPDLVDSRASDFVYRKHSVLAGLALNVYKRFLGTALS